MKMSIVITSTETALIQEFDIQDIKYNTSVLDIGDIHILHNDKPVYVIERKAKTDLDASIKDGRYKEQKHRLLQSGCRIIYLIEDLKWRSTDKSAKSRVWHAMTNTIVRDNCNVFQTKNIKDTVYFLQSLAWSIDQHYDTDINTHTTEDIIKVDIKTKHVTPEKWWMYSLSLIKGVSLDMAKVITDNYATKELLALAYNEKGEYAISDIAYRKRKIGKQLSKRIYTYIIQLN